MSLSRFRRFDNWLFNKISLWKIRQFGKMIDTPTDTPQPAPQSLTSGQQGIEIPQTDKSASADRNPVNRNYFQRLVK